MQFSSKKLIVLSIALLLSACNGDATQAPPSVEKAQPPITSSTPAATETTTTIDKPKVSIDDPEVVVIVNGSPVTKTMYAAFHQQWRQARQGAKGDTQKEQMAILNELVNAMLIVQDAEAQGFNKKPEVEVLLNLLRTRALAEMSVANFVQQQPISDDDLKKIYDTRYGSKQQQEFKAKHILLNSEEAANDVIKELGGGADFTELAKAQSTGPSASQGGDLGWFESTQMVKPFADAVIAMKNGEHSITPVKTQFGWHVILREDSRETSPPAFDDIKKTLLDGKRRELVMGYLTDLRSKADIQIKPPTQQTEKADAAAEPKPAH